MRGLHVWLVVALLAGAALTGLLYLSTANSGHSSAATVEVQSLQVAKAGPLAPLVFASFSERDLTVVKGSDFVLNLSLSFYSAGDDGVPLTNATSADVTLLVNTPGFSLVRMSYPHLLGSLSKVSIPANSVTDIQVTVEAPDQPYTGSLSISLDATTGS